jgi:hypothetical protein
MTVFAATDPIAKLPRDLHRFPAAGAPVRQRA